MVGTAELWRQVPALERVPAGVALTFDDGPDPDSTPAVLDAIDAAGVRTACVLPRGEALQHPPAPKGGEQRGGGDGDPAEGPGRPWGPATSSPHPGEAASAPRRCPLARHSTTQLLGS